MKPPRKVDVLLVEDNPGDADYIKLQLAKASETAFDVKVAGWLQTALTMLANDSFDVVLLDLSLNDSQGIDTVVRVREADSRIPIIVMTGSDDLQMAITCVNYDAQDYLIKNEVQAKHLERSILQAIARARKSRNSKRFMRAVVERYTSPDDPTSLTLIRGQVEAVHDFYDKLMDYVRRDARGHLDNIEAIRDATGAEQAIAEMMGVMESAETKQREVATKTDPPRRIRDEAAVTLSGLKPVKAPEDPAEARAAIADALEELSEDA